MPLSSMQLIALMNIPGIGKKTAAKLSQKFESVPSNDEFLERLSSKDRGGKKQITKDNLLAGLSHAKEVLEKSESLGINSLNIYEEKYPQNKFNLPKKDYKDKVEDKTIFRKMWI